MKTSKLLRPQVRRALLPRYTETTRLDRLLLWACLLVLSLTVLYPSGRLLVEAARSWQPAAVLSGAGFEAIVNTLVLGVATVAVSGTLGTALALLLHNYSFPGRGILAAAAYLPFALPPLVGVLSFWYLIGDDGAIIRLLERLLATDLSVRGFCSVLIIHAYSFYVFYYAMASAALQDLDASALEAARTLGASRWRVFTRITLPLLRPALAGASLLAFMSSGASFSAPFFFGQDFPVLSTQIYHEQIQFRVEAVRTLTVVLAALSLLGVLIFRSRPYAGGTASKGAPRRVQSRAGRVLAGLAAWAAVGVLILPHLTILGLSFANHRQWQTELIPHAYTLANYRRLFEDPEMLQPIWNSIWMSGAAVAMILITALPAGYLIARRKPGGRWLNMLIMVPWALPGTVVAINMIIAFNDPWLPLYGTIWILPLAYFVRYVPLLARMSIAAIEPFDATLVEAGRVLGAGRLYCLRRIVLPLLLPAIAAGSALIFTQCLGEFVASILLYSPSNLPISVKIYERWNGSGIGSAFAYSVFLMVLVAAAFGITRRFGMRSL